MSQYLIYNKKIEISFHNFNQFDQYNMKDILFFSVINLKPFKGIEVLFTPTYTKSD